MKKCPVEIRNQIYQPLLDSATPIDLSENNKLIRPPGDISLEWGGATFDINARILRTCKQVYEEAMSILYSNNFVISGTKEAKIFQVENMPLSPLPQGVTLTRTELSHVAYFAHMIEY